MRLAARQVRGALPAIGIYANQSSFARATEALRMGPTLTYAVAALEVSLGARLLSRNTRRSSLTREGGLFYQRAVQILGEVQAARKLLGSNQEAPRRRLRVDIPFASDTSLIVPCLLQFTKRYPDDEIILGASDQPVDFLGEEIDCALRLSTSAHHSVKMSGAFGQSGGADGMLATRG